MGETRAAAWCVEVEDFFDLETSLDADSPKKRLALATSALDAVTESTAHGEAFRAFASALMALLDQVDGAKALKEVADEAALKLTRILARGASSSAFFDAASFVEPKTWRSEACLPLRWQVAARQGDGRALEAMRPDLERSAAASPEALRLFESYGRLTADRSTAKGGKNPWHPLVLDALLTRDFLPLIAHCEKLNADSAEDRLLTYLYLTALSPLGLRRRLQTPRNTRRQLGGAWPEGGRLDTLGALAELVEATFENGATRATKRRRLQTLHAQSALHPDLEVRALSLAAGFAVARLADLGVLGDAFESEYRTLARALTGEADADPWRIADVTTNQTSAKNPSMLAAASKLGLLAAADRMNRLVSSSEDQARRSRILTTRAAEALGDVVGTERGAFQKLLQLSEIFVEVLPEELVQRIDVSARGEAATFDSGPVLKEQYGGQPPFERFDARPFARGSLGQVHHATLPGGRAVAVKVRYPGVQAKLKEDFKRMRRLVPVIKAVASSVPWDKVLDGWLKIYEDECDYLLEAKRTARAREALLAAKVGGVSIPAVVLEHCRGAVLVQDLCHGVSFDTFAANASEAERDRAGENLMRANVALLKKGIFSYDLHAENFQFEGSTIHWIDHGGVSDEGDKEAGILAVIRALAQGDDEAAWPFLAPYATAGVDRAAIIKEMREAFGPILSADEFRFSPEVARATVRRLFASMRQGRLTIPIDISMVGVRFFVSLYHLLGKLRAKARWAETWTG